MAGDEKPTNVSVYVKLVTVGVPFSTLVQFPFGQVAASRKLWVVGAVEVNDDTVIWPFLTSVMLSGAGEAVVVCVFTSTICPPWFLHWTTAEYDAVMVTLASVLPMPPIFVPLHDTVRPLMEHVGAELPFAKCAPFGALLRSTVVVRNRGDVGVGPVLVGSLLQAASARAITGRIAMRFIACLLEVFERLTRRTCTDREYACGLPILWVGSRALGSGP
jgi:hypothetical protein